MATSKFINVQTDFHAHGDGTNDDTGPLTNAFAAANTYDDAVIYFPPGIYLCQSAPTLVITSNGTADVIADAPLSVTIQLAVATSQGIVFQPGSSFTGGSIRNIEIEYLVTPSSSTYGVHLLGCSNIWIENVQVTAI